MTKEMANIFEGSIYNRDIFIRICLLFKICPECGGKIRYRISFNPKIWWISLLTGLKIRVCICKLCGVKKKLILAQ